MTEKSKNRLDITSEELERVLLQKEGESLKETVVPSRAGGVGGKRAIGKAVAKGGLLLKGKNPGNASIQFPRFADSLIVFLKNRFSDRKTTSGQECQPRLINTGKP